MLYRAADVRSLEALFATEIRIGPHYILADEPAENGGDDTGPKPHDFLLAALGACTSMTLRMYAQRKGWPLTGVHVHLTQEAIEGEHRFHRTIELEGALDDEQRARLLEIANKCPVHRTLTGKITVQSKLGKAATP
jgi:putative redox protein